VLHEVSERCEITDIQRDNDLLGTVTARDASARRSVRLGPIGSSSKFFR